jgi:hypothetical protein
VFDQWVEFRRLSLKEGRQSTLPQILRIFKKEPLPTHGRLSIYDKLPRPVRLSKRNRTTRGVNDSGKMSDLVQAIIPIRLGEGWGLDQNSASDLDVVALPKLPPRTQSLSPYERVACAQGFPETLRNLKEVSPAAYLTAAHWPSNHVSEHPVGIDMCLAIQLKSFGKVFDA